MSRVRRVRGLVLAAVLGAAVVGLPAPAIGALPPIRHVFMIVLENESASTTFGAGSPARYVPQTLRAQGAYLPNYYGIGHASLDNYIAMVSGQAPNLDTQTDCQQFVNVSPARSAATARRRETAASIPPLCRRSRASCRPRA